MQETVFSKIIKGELPSVRLYEDEICIVILDINPVAKGHSLVICKQVIPTVEDTPDSILSHMILVTKKVDSKLREVLHCDATNILINNGPAAGQDVPQLHIHVIPRYHGDRTKMPIPHEKYADGEMADLGKKLAL
ncbi:MAG: HIT family protein [Sphaerochaetaceae bacterium]|jgi:histidine triad (HIT) family protein|nr:HIT family protein [Sphaerochaetaceae bacterium]MDD3163126.1 HIT family protein [Sphaerochaetaceae bacterium]MDD4006652.1 HIT family protein [Sphaerochaetaceae bacterium]MDD4396224.1 HIT family protein [Sphaerochaetaceae bacterium]